MDFNIEPHKGAHPLLIGMTREATRALLNQLEQNNNADEPENDFYTKDGLILGFNSENLLEFIEMFPPSRVTAFGVDVFRVKLSKLVARIEELDHRADLDLGGYRFVGLGIALYCPQRKLESISLFAPGYYDKFNV